MVHGATIAMVSVTDTVHHHARAVVLAAPDAQVVLADVVQDAHHLVEIMVATVNVALIVLTDVLHPVHRQQLHRQEFMSIKMVPGRVLKIFISIKKVLGIIVNINKHGSDYT